MEEKIKELEKRIEELNYYTRLYDEDRPEISDRDWDDLYFALAEKEKEYNIYLPNSPTQKINYEVKSKLDKVEHSHPMLSLDKTKDIDVVKSFLGKKKYICMGKMDGLTCSLTYRNGFLVKAETRGNGTVGEDILHNALAIKNIPRRIPLAEEYVIDGEVICDLENFKLFENEYKNPRNFASGSVRLLDNKESAKRNLSFVAWDCVKGLEGIDTLSKKLKFLHNMFNFTVVPFVCDNLTDISTCIEKVKRMCQEKYYPIDGVVFKYNDVDEYNAAGRTDHHFKGGIAFKFYDEKYETVLKDIEWGMGRTGILTPVAIFESIDIDGTEVERASLHNISILEETLHKPYKGQKIEVAKMNQIIPQVVGAVWESKEYDTFKNGLFAPHICPICGEETIVKKENDSKVLFCNNPNCEGKLLNRFEHFCSKKGLDIKGLSKATLEKLMNWGWLNTYKDLFLLNEYKDEWMKKSGFGAASVNKILNSIEEAKNTTLEKVIAAAGIGEIGTRVAKDLASHYDTWTDFRTETNFLQYNGIGEVMNHNLLTFDYDDLDLDYTVNTFLTIEEKDKEEDSVKSLDGKVLCITGKLNKFKNRNELQADIESKGGRVVSSMSSKVDYLINNDIESTSSKNKAAKSAGIPIITEDEYLAL